MKKDDIDWFRLEFRVQIHRGVVGYVEYTAFEVHANCC